MLACKDIDFFKVVVDARNLKQRYNRASVVVKVVAIDLDLPRDSELLCDFDRPCAMHSVLDTLLLSTDSHCSALVPLINLIAI